MKAVILAGGLGTRLAEETSLRPKPMVEIGGKPILWHIMKIYSAYGVNDFVICLGYKGYMVKEYFSNYFTHNSDITIDLNSNNINIHHKSVEPWRVTLVDTGESTQTGGRVRRVRHHLQDEEAFCLTYGDGVGDIDIGALMAFHKRHGRLATVTAVRPPGRFGMLDLEGDRVTRFNEKPIGDGSWINGGFFVLSRDVIDLIAGDQEPLEDFPLRTLVARDQLRAFLHDGFWQPMDTLREKNLLEDYWASGCAQWKCW
ncbi:glucose-1-phosphate cytidylyltransferase [Telmatospirillum siberiense]|uniref:Glucose-1-phosphate cytidylyltransferase n=1 Tax=Telmatospirillum siberiense TaxID=382514 RepID=A0A2N3Q007_9PROT|nr:glucose-1-phosphate cytidylyltransferase [Telmatospirillum siberiense]PKU25990.1 glucose-1-phosphate cytidylyltransferase [Telmatospirillum siberiense]